MKTTSKSNPPSADPGSQSYERLLSAAQAAQSYADRAVADLAAIKRTLSEAPRVTQLRREELAKAQQALERAENELTTARQQLAGKQAEAARLIEAAADAQRALAQALIKQDVMPESQMAEMVQSRKPGAQQPPPSFSNSSSGASPSFAATLGTNRYTPMPSMHPADLHAEVMEYLRDRDALCPSCGHSLRGIDAARCPGCRLQLSVNVLKSVRAHWMTAVPVMWAVRILAFVAMGLCAYLAVTRYKPFGCGLGSDCHFAFQSSWAKIVGIPVGVFAAPIYLGILLCTGFINIGLTDQTRRKAWSIMAALSMLAGVAGVWFIIVQVFFLRAICPHCLVVDIFGIAIACIVLTRAPLGKPEKLPERAAGPIVIPGSSAMTFATAAVVAVAVFAGVQLMNWRATPQPDRKEFGPKPAEEKLLMPGLEIDVPTEKPPAPAPPKQPDPEFRLSPELLPKTPSKQPEPSKQPDKAKDAGAAATPDPVKKPSVELDLKPAAKESPTPAADSTPAAAGKEDEDKKDEKKSPDFDFAPTIDLNKK